MQCTSFFRLAAASALEGVAVYTLTLGRICLVGTDADSVEGAVVFRTAVVAAGGNGAVNVRILFLVFHNSNPYLPKFRCGFPCNTPSITRQTGNIQTNYTLHFG